MEILELAVRVLSDPLPEEPINAVYLFGQTTDNQHSVFASAQELVQKNIVSSVVIPGSAERCGYPGQLAWFEELSAYGINTAQIVTTDTSAYSILHTKTESEAVIKLAKEKGWRSLAVCAAPFHQLRAFITMVSVALDLYPELKLYSYPGKALAWSDQVMHSQGKLSALRYELIQEENKRIDTYAAKGDLHALTDIVAYLNCRSV